MRVRPLHASSRARLVAVVWVEGREKAVPSSEKEFALSLDVPPLPVGDGEAADANE